MCPSVGERVWNERGAQVRMREPQGKAIGTGQAAREREQAGVVEGGAAGGRVSGDTTVDMNLECAVRRPCDTVRTMWSTMWSVCYCVWAGRGGADDRKKLKIAIVH